MTILSRCCLTGLILATSWTSPAPAQQFDPRVPLGQLISAFQMCGPPQTYQMLSQQMFMLIAQQTGGQGCYAQIAQAGPVTSMAVLAQQPFPIGPLYIIRVRHQGGAVADWFIGFNQMNGKVESLTFQAAQEQRPTIETGPTPEGGGSPAPGPKPQPTPQPDGDSTDGGDGCDLYPAMC